MREAWSSVLLLPALATAGCKAAVPCPVPTAQEAPAPDPGVPAGFVQVKVVGVMPTVEGNALLLREDRLGRVLPIFIGDAEANVIDLRLAGEQFERPLTHDLLDTVMERLGGDLVRVLVNKIRGNVFLGTVVLRQGDRYFQIDARPSDAVALAVGHGAPVYVTTWVLEAAGLPLDRVPPP